jgi:hypothetical protein
MATHQAVGVLDVVRKALSLVLQTFIDAEVAQHIGAGICERTQARATHRNGTSDGCSPPTPAMSSSRSPSSGKDPLFLALLE